MVTNPIRLYAATQPIDILPDNVYFAFASGRLVYDCVSCESKCCRGFGFLATKATELPELVASRRALPLFVFPDGDNNTLQHRVRNCAPGCFFLSETGRCEIHGQFGFDAKPETCRLFPFNNLRRIGPYLLVQPHDSLCPLEIAPPSRKSELSDHDALIGVMRSKGIRAPIPVIHGVSGDVAGVIEFERKIVALSDLRLGIASYVAFATEQAQLSSTRESTGQIVGSSVEEVFRLACDALDIDDNERVDQSADVAMAMIAVTPFLRLRMLLPDPMLPNASAIEPLELPRLPHALVVIYLISELARRAGMKRITFQTLSRIEQEFRPLVRLLAYADVPMVWKRGAPIAPEGFDNLEDRTRFLSIARALLPEVQRCQTARLADILMAHAPRDRVERMLFLKLAAANLLGKLVPLDRDKDHEFKADIRSRMSARIHRWMLYNTDDGSMKTAARLIS